MSTSIILVLRALATLFGLQGQTKTQSTINLLLDAAESGLNVDEHMKHVAEDLKNGVVPNWDDVLARIQADSDRLHRP